MIYTEAQQEEVQAENRKTRAKDIKLVTKYDEVLFLATTAQAISFIIQSRRLVHDSDTVTRADLLAMRNNILKDIK